VHTSGAIDELEVAEKIKKKCEQPFVVCCIMYDVEGIMGASPK